MEIYVKCKSKKELNSKLADNSVVIGINYSIFGSGGYYELNKDLPDRTIIKIFDKYVNGSPFAKSYGIWNSNKLKVI